MTMPERTRRFERAYLGPREPLLDEILRSSLVDDRLRAMQMDDNAARVLGLMVSLSGATTVLEIGTYFGWSAIHIGRALGTGGSLVTLEVDDDCASRARRNLQKLDLANCTVETTDAVEFMIKAGDRGDSFDLIFIDGAKRQYPEYLKHAYPLLGAGGLLLTDDCFGDGDYSAEDGGHEAAVAGIRRYVRAVTMSPKLVSYLIPTQHGLLVSRKRGDRQESSA